MGGLRAVRDKEEIYKLYTHTVQKKNAYSNCYFKPDQPGKWFDEGILQYYAYGSEGLVMGVSERGYTKLFFDVPDFKWVQELEKVKAGTGAAVIAVEVVSKGGNDPYGLSRILPYQEIKRYSRFRRSGSNFRGFPGETPQYCEISDLPFIREMINSTFGPIGDELPDDGELRTFIENKNIICIRDGSKRDGADLSGYLIFEDKGRTSYIRNVCVRQDARGKGTGRRLLDMYLGIHREFKGFTLWCKDDNSSALQLYVRGGVLQ